MDIIWANSKKALTYIPVGLIIKGLVLAAVVAGTHAFLAEMGIWRKELDVKNKHCYVTGGSSGLGQALAVDLVKRGAHVTIIARGQERLDAVKAELETHASTSQIIQAISADLTDAESASSALLQSTKSHHGRCPDHFYLCAGYAKPQMFIDASAKDLKENLDGTYWVSAYTAHAATKMMVSQRIHGKIVFVSSLCGYVSFAGYSPYSPGKYALRGLADSLRSEMLLHNISVHIFMPASIRSAGWEVEEQTKPRVTKKIEDGDEVLPPADVSESLIAGIEKGYYQITNVIVCDLLRVQSKGAVPHNNLLMDMIYTGVALIGVPIWRLYIDYLVRQDAPAVEKELEARGFYKPVGGNLSEGRPSEMEVDELLRRA